MAYGLPVSSQRLGAAETSLPSWIEARSRLEDAQFYWLATVRPDGQPHVMPILAVWLDGSLHFSAAPDSRKARNLTYDARCVVTVDSDDLHLVLEGATTKVIDPARLRRVADQYASKYGWHVTVRDGAFYADGAPTAGPPPYVVYEVTPTKVFGFGTDESYGAARWRFS